MHLVVYEDSLWARMAPLSLSRPVFMLTLGNRTLLERSIARLKPSRLTLWVRPEMEKLCQQQALRFNIPVTINHPLDQEPALLLNSRTALVGAEAPSDQNAQTAHHALRHAGGNSNVGPSDALHATDAWRRFELAAQPEPVGRLAHSLADLIHWNHEAIVEDFADNGIALAAPPAGPFHLVDPARLRLGQDVHLEPGCVIDASSGPILLSDRVTVGAGAVLKGPCAIGSCTVIAALSQIRPCTTIGANCRIGGEVSASIILSHSNKAHEGYLGHSYLGEWVNLGAGTTTSNLKNTYGEVVLKVGSRRVPTGRQFLGSLIGDHSKTGILTRLMTGTYIGYCSMLAGSASPPSSVPSFTFITDAGHAPYRLDKAAEVARRVYQRRGKEWVPDDEALMHYVAHIAPHVEA